MKQCTKCKEWKNKSEFHKNKTRKDGLQHECKECKKLRHNNYNRTDTLKRYNNSIKGKKTRKRYEKREKGIQAIIRYRTSDKYKHISMIYARRYRRNNPEKNKAHQYIDNAIDTKKIPPAKLLKCNICNKQADHYHHPDYSKPEYVIPLCRQCHTNTHKEISQ